tara:strand:+ start:291 stop:443 length:153 start_codon:yes stop_codon:yes gene_type:complete
MGDRKCSISHHSYISCKNFDTLLGIDVLENIPLYNILGGDEYYKIETGDH